MFDPGDVADLDTATTVAELAQVRTRQRWWQAREVALLAHYADVTGHGETGPDAPAARVLHGDRMVPGGGDGTPEVSEFAALEIAALWNEGVEGVDGRIHQALDLRHRFPALWRRVMDADLPVWVAAKITMKASRLDREAAGRLDLQVADVVGGLPVSRLLRLVDGIVLKLTPPDRADTTRADDRARRGVWVRQRPADLATTVAYVSAVLDAVDADAVEQQVRRIAHLLAQGGDGRGLDERLAAALGMLAFPARALQLLQASILDELPTDAGESWGPCPAAGQAGHLCGRVTVDPDRLLPTAEIVIHLSGAAITGSSATRSTATTTWPTMTGASGDHDAIPGDQAAVARVERVGPVLVDWLGDLLAHHRVSVRPVLDAGTITPVDSYEIPERMREAIGYRQPYDCFPGSTRHGSHGCDLDHTEPYRPGGPPGQTSLDNLSPISRRAHRAKTHGGWRLRQPIPGVLIWRSPHGYTYLVTAGHSIRIGSPHERAHIVA